MSTKTSETPSVKTRPPRLKYEASSNRYYIDNYKIVDGKPVPYKHYFPKCINQKEALRRVQKLNVKLKPLVNNVPTLPQKQITPFQSTFTSNTAGTSVGFRIPSESISRRFPLKYNFNTGLTYDKYLRVQNAAVDILKTTSPIVGNLSSSSIANTNKEFKELSVKYEELKKAFDDKVKEFEGKANTEYETRLTTFEAKVNALLANNLENKEEVVKLRRTLRQIRDEFKVEQKTQLENIKATIRDEIKATTDDFNELKERDDLSREERNELANEYRRQLAELKQDMLDVRTRQRGLEDNIKDLVDKADGLLEAAERQRQPVVEPELEREIQDAFDIPGDEPNLIIPDPIIPEPEIQIPPERELEPVIPIQLPEYEPNLIIPDPIVPELPRPPVVEPELEPVIPVDRGEPELPPVIPETGEQKDQQGPLVSSPENRPPDPAREGKNTDMDPVDEVDPGFADLEIRDVPDVEDEGVNNEPQPEDAVPAEPLPEQKDQDQKEEKKEPRGEPRPPAYRARPPIRSGAPFQPKDREAFFAAFPDLAQFEGQIRKPDKDYAPRSKIMAVRSRIRSLLKDDARMVQQLQNLAEFDENILEAIFATINSKSENNRAVRLRRNQAFTDLVIALEEKGLGKKEQASIGKDPNYPGLYSDDINKIMQDEDNYVGVISEDQIPYLPVTDVGGAVVNNGKEHWYALYWSKPDGYIGYVDSLNLKPNDEAIKNIKTFGKKLAPNHYLKLKISDVVTQRANGNNCGWYACKVLKDLFNGADFPSATNYGIHGMKLSDVLVDGKVKPSLIKQAEKTIKQFKKDNFRYI